jgi:hypothetical protein
MYCTLHAHLCKPGRPANHEHWCIFRQQLRAEESLFIDRNTNELLFINLADGLGGQEF